MNTVTLQGRLVKDIKIKRLNNQEQTAVGYGVLAIDRGYSKEDRESKQKKNQQIADFVPIRLFGKRAEVLEQYCEKGNRVCLQGKIRSYSYLKDDERKSGFYLLVEDIDIIDWKTQDEVKKEEPLQEKEDIDYNMIEDDDLDTPFLTTEYEEAITNHNNLEDQGYF